VCEGNVIGAVAYACENRVPPLAKRARLGVTAASTTSARVVSSVTSRIDGRRLSRAEVSSPAGAREQAHPSKQATPAAAVRLVTDLTKSL